MLIPAKVDLPRYQPDDRRICHLLGTGEDEPVIVIVGFPSDAGVTLNGGRPGAAHGPDAIRNAFYRMTPGSAGKDGLYTRVRDLGNVQVSGDVGEDQKLLAESVAPYLNAGAICVVLGGGHETTYGHYLGYVANEIAPRIINWDAHADVRRPVDGAPTSGSSFYLALNHDTHPTPQYTVCGLLPHSVAPAHVAFLHEKNCPHYWRADITGEVIDEIYADASGPTLVSFDLDAIDQALAPGVSAPAVGGLDTATWLQAAYGAGVSSSVSSIDICELNPLLDADGHTARLAALTLWTFLSGCAARLGIQRFIRSR
jgi:formiminoglutamase